MPGNKHILITGRPGVGKTTLLKRINDFLVNQGVVVGGVFCPEIKSKDKRTGFAIIDIMTQKRGILAKKGLQSPKIGSYSVNLEDLNDIGVGALQRARLSADYILLDEIAPMELKSPLFISEIRNVFDGPKTVIAVIHQKSNHELILEIKNRDDVRLFDVNRENMEQCYNKIISLLNY